MTTATLARRQKAQLQDIEHLRTLLERGLELTKDHAEQLMGLPERRFRLAVSALRHEGYPVISTSEAGSTYRKARTADELEGFIAHELESRVSDINTQIRALRAAANRHFGDVVQEALFATTSRTSTHVSH